MDKKPWTQGSREIPAKKLRQLVDLLNSNASSNSYMMYLGMHRNEAEMARKHKEVIVQHYKDYQQKKDRKEGKPPSVIFDMKQKKLFLIGGVTDQNKRPPNHNLGATIDRDNDVLSIGKHQQKAFRYAISQGWEYLYGQYGVSREEIRKEIERLFPNLNIQQIKP